MQVRVFEATDMATGLRMVKKELGPDALILSTRTIKNGKFGLLGKPVLEITAAIDADYQPETAANGSRAANRWPYGEPAPANEQNSPGSSYRGAINHVIDDSVEEYLHAGLRDQPGYSQPEPAHVKEELPPAKNSELQNEVNELKDLVRSLAGQITQLSERREAAPGKQPAIFVREPNNPAKFAAPALQGDHILSNLIDKGINVETARTIAGFLRESLTDQELSKADLVQAAVVDIITSLIEVNPPLPGNYPDQQRIALLGPTGVGKTTTLAKIAASSLAKHNAKIALITIDTYRIAAVEQLKVYGEIMRIPVDVVISPGQLTEAIERHRDKDLILIDTAGRSPQDQLCIEELGSFLRPELNIDKHLVLSAATRENEIMDTIERFEKIGITHTIFTKIDECTQLGILLNIQIQNSNPLSYITNGQRVPEDLLELSPKLVAELIMAQHIGSMHDEYISSGR